MQRVVYPSIFLVESVFSSWNINRIEINVGEDDIVKNSIYDFSYKM